MVTTLKTSKIAAFTLIELVMVIVILSLLSAATISKFINLSTRAIEKSEDAIVATLNVAIKAKYVENVSNGIDPVISSWPNSNPLALLSQVPPYLYGSWNKDTQDNYNWRISNQGGCIFTIGCPHYNGNDLGLNSTKGRYWIYSYAADMSGHHPGDFWMEQDLGH